MKWFRGLIFENELEFQVLIQNVGWKTPYIPNVSTTS